MREKFFIVRASATELETYRAAAELDAQASMSSWARALLGRSAIEAAEAKLEEAAEVE